MPSKYLLIREFSPKANLCDLDEGDEQLIKFAAGAEVSDFGDLDGLVNGNWVLKLNL